MDKKEAYSINIFIFKTQLLQEVPLEQLHLPSAFLSGIQTLIVDKAGDQCCVPEHTTTFHMWYTLTLGQCVNLCYLKTQTAAVPSQEVMIAAVS